MYNDFTAYCDHLHSNRNYSLQVMKLVAGPKARLTGMETTVPNALLARNFRLIIVEDLAYQNTVCYTTIMDTVTLFSLAYSIKQHQPQTQANLLIKKTTIWPLVAEYAINHTLSKTIHSRCNSLLTHAPC